MRGVPGGLGGLCVLAIFLAPGFGGAEAAARTLTPEQHNLAYCILVLTGAEFGGERAGEDDPGSAAVLMQRLTKQLARSEAEIVAETLPPIAAMVAADMTRKGRPRFSATACAGHAHYIRTTPLP